MSCLSVTAAYVDGSMSVDVRDVSKYLSWRAYSLGGLSCAATSLSEPLEATVRDLSSRMSVRLGVVCSVAEANPYINIADEPIWLLPENDFSWDVVVESNVNWIIE